MAAQKGKPRDKYISRLELEFKSEDKIQREDLDVIDSYFEHRRFAKMKERAL